MTCSVPLPIGPIPRRKPDRVGTTRTLDAQIQVMLCAQDRYDADPHLQVTPFRRACVTLANRGCAAVIAVGFTAPVAAQTEVS